MESYGELQRATECYKELQKDMGLKAVQNTYVTCQELWRATESYGELWVPMVKKIYLKFIYYWLRATESYGELQTAKESY